jgi:hypothetical protein
MVKRLLQRAMKVQKLMADLLHYMAIAAAVVVRSFLHYLLPENVNYAS